MQLVGATRGFIRKPFLIMSIVNGLIGAAIAMALLFGILYLSSQELDDIISFTETELMILLGSCILLISIVINWISTFFAVNKYLNIKTDKLYY